MATCKRMSDTLLVSGIIFSLYSIFLYFFTGMLIKYETCHDMLHHRNVLVGAGRFYGHYRTFYDGV